MLAHLKTLCSESLGNLETVLKCVHSLQNVDKRWQQQGMDCIFSYLLLSESASCVRHCAQRERRLKREWCWSLIWRNSPSQYIWSDDSKHKWVWVVSTLSEVVGFYVLWLGFWCRIHTYMWYILTHNWNQSIERNTLANLQSSKDQRALTLHNILKSNCVCRAQR